jgi:hypothetical protein
MRAICALRVGAAVVVSAAMLGPAAAGAAESASQSFETTGEHPFVVPAGVTSVQVMLVGGNAGSGLEGGLGGTAATVTATLAVSPGQTLYAEVAGNGESAEGAHNRGGYGGGGKGSERAFGGNGGGGGGGASDLRTCAVGAPASACGGRQSLASRLVVAAGGGGGGGNGFAPASTAGGNGGTADQSGFNGKADAHGDEGGSGGKRATLSAGGEAGAPSVECKPKTGEYCAMAGGLGEGGAGGTSILGGGGGGGGGVFGGGGGGGGGFHEFGVAEFGNGGGGGGGGGSSGVPAGAAGVSVFSLVPTATGAQPSIAISWTKPPPAALTAAPSTVTSNAATLNGTVNPDGSQVSDCHFLIAPAPPGGGSIPCVQQIGGGSTPVAASANLAGLAPATTYTVALTASSAQGTSTGATVTFATPVAVASTPPNANGNGAHGGAVTIGDLKLSPSRFRHGKHPTTRAKTKTKAVPTATTISFSLSEAATVTLTFEAIQPGMMVGHKCAGLAKAHRKGRPCKRFVVSSGAMRRSAHAGTNRLHFDGVLDGGKPLAPGAYRLSLAAGAARETTTSTQHTTFTVVK